MFVTDGLEVLNAVFPQLALHMHDAFDDMEETARRLHALALSNAPMNDRAAIIRRADELGLWVRPDGCVRIRG